MNPATKYRKGDRVRLVNHRYAGATGTVHSVYANWDYGIVRVQVQFDGADMPVDGYSEYELELL